MPRVLSRIAIIAACETPRKLTRRAAALIFMLFLTGAPMKAIVERPAGARASAEATAPGANSDQAAGAPGVNEDHAARGGIVSVLARIVNFAILAGTLIYVLRSPLHTYLRDRSTQIRHDLVSAAQMKETAAAHIEEIDRKMHALPGELEKLRAQGAQETAAEEARILAAAAVERDRLLDQARREIDLQVKVAERELVSHAADLAIEVASERIRKSITDEDQQRLVDRYVQQLKS